MKIAVLGGGTAGFVAAAHLTRHLPDAALLHVFDTRIPTIGVGEGTTPRFPVWFAETTGLGFADLAARCGATLKKGTQFDGWGQNGPPFLNRFQPTRLIGYHFDAAEVVRLLAEHVRAHQVDARVGDLQRTADGVLLRLDTGETHRCDYVFDARGFPRPANGTADADGDHDDIVHLDWIPTGRAMLRRLSPGRLSGVTRAAARPHGWIFQIPLQGWTSCGYIFNPRINTDAEIAADFAAFLAAEQVDDWEDRGALNFPNFTRRRMSDGRVFWVGNAASFLEPLEATAICTAVADVREATRLIIDHGTDSGIDAAALAGFNATMLYYVLRNSLFLAWHYACGSRWDTPFWRHARQGLERARNHPLIQPHIMDMDAFVQAGRTLPGLMLPAYEDEDQWLQEVYPLLKLYRPFGNFSELNFAQVGHGIGYYGARPAANAAAEFAG